MYPVLEFRFFQQTVMADDLEMCAHISFSQRPQNLVLQCIDDFGIGFISQHH